MLYKNNSSQQPPPSLLDAFVLLYFYIFTTIRQMCLHLGVLIKCKAFGVCITLSLVHGGRERALTLRPLHNPKSVRIHLNPDLNRQCCQDPFLNPGGSWVWSGRPRNLAGRVAWDTRVINFQRISSTSFQLS